MNDRSQLPPQAAEQPGASYAGRTRYTQLEYEAVLANASIGIAFTRDRKFFLCNPKFAEMFGWKPEDLIGQPGDVVYPSRESYEALGAIAIPILSAGRQLDLEWEFRRKDGSTFLARAIAKAIGGRDSQQGTIWIAEDITERRRQADELQRVLREQEAILNTASIGICFVKDRRIVRCTRRFEQMHGYAAGELAGRPTSILYANEADHAAVGEAYARMSSGSPCTVEVPTRRKDGSVYWSRVTACAVDPSDPAKGTVWLDEDITGKRHAEEELQRVLAEQQALLENVVIGIAFARDRKVVRCNRRFEALFGYEAGEALGVSTRQFYFTDQEFEDQGRVLDELDQGRTHTREQWLRRKDGSGFWCRLTGRAVEPGNPAKGYAWLFEDVTERRRTDEHIRRLAADQQLILDNASVGIMFVRDRVIQRCNPKLEEMTGAAPGELIGKSTAELFASETDWNEAGRLAYGTTAPGGTHEAEWLFRRRDGTTFLCRNRGRRIDSGEPPQEWIWSVEDVTIERQAAERVRRALIEQDLILDNATVGISFVRNRVYQRCNPRLEEMFGYEPGEMLGRSTEIVYPSREAFEQAGKDRYARLAAAETVTEERQVRRKDGSLFWCKVVGRAIDPAHPHEGSIWIYDDVTAERAARESLEASRLALERAVAERTAELQAANRRLEAEIGERKLAESRAQHLADHDALTGLPNRRLLEDRLTQALALSYRNRKLTAVMFVDLDRFKNVNDSLGHAVGDALLKEVAQRLVKQLRVGDTVCRIGGDEFVVVLPEMKRSSDAAHVAQKITEALAQPVAAAERELRVTPSIGISVFPDDGRDAETLIRNADAAMYHAKETGRAKYQFFTEQMNLAANRRLALENDLRRAVQRGELRVHYQPVTELATGRVVAHEALLRWQHPARGLVAPGEFIQLAEDTGLILGIGEWVLGEACRWAASIGAERGLAVGVNLSARQFTDPRLPELVAGTLRESGLPPHLLELEIAESTVMQQVDVAAATLRKLKDLGVTIAIDDFGTGYSSLAFLRRFPVDKLKIDRLFVADLPGERDSQAIVAAIVGLGHALGLKVAAEGVESAPQREFLAGCGCDYVQGKLSGPPADAESAAKEYV